MADISITGGLLDAVEHRSVHLLAGLEVPEFGTIRKTNFDGTTTLAHEGPELPGGRELLAHVLEAGYRLSERAAVVAKEAAIAELLMEEAQKRNEGAE